jgi:hypothetical protein
MGTTAEHNQWTFDFLRRRREFVATFGADPYAEKIEQHIVWGATVAAIGRIHARRVGGNIRPDRECFIHGLLDLAPGYGLSTVSIPLLAHDLKSDAAASPLRGRHPIIVYERAAYQSLHWDSRKDRELAAELEAMRAKQPPPIEKLFRQNRYAEILYRDYRCSVVHGLDFGAKTMDFPSEGDAPPIYRNYVVGLDPDIPPERQVRTRIMFPLGLLAEILSAMIEREESEAAQAGWKIPRDATLED